MSSHQRWVDWLDEAEDDLATATDLLRLGRFSKACYFAQQAAEKALLIKKLNRYVHTHSVRELLEIVREGGIHIGEDLLRIGDMLDRYYVPTRYPNAWPSGAPHRHYTEGDAREAIEYASKVMGFVRSNL